MSVHPSEHAELELAARRRVLAWAAAEGLQVTPAAAGRLVAALRGGPTATPEPALAVVAPVVPLAAYRDGDLR